MPKGVYPRSKEHNKKISESLIGFKNPMFGKESPFKGKNHTMVSRLKISNSHKGESNANWRGGVSIKNRTERQNIMSSFEYKLWRESVFIRDNWTCVWCGFKGYVEADHIKPFALFPELRFVIDNGRTLCKPCHKTTDSYGCKIR